MKFSKWLHVPKKIIEQQFCELAEKEIGLRGKILFEKSKIKKKKKGIVTPIIIVFAETQMSYW